MSIEDMRLQVLTHVADCLAELHQTGWVHRDIKPGNVMMLLGKKRWTPIDFGCAAKIGTMAKNIFTIVYAPPEVLRACWNGDRLIAADPAMDAWSVGVMALEMYTHETIFRNEFLIREEVLASIYHSQQHA